jgi:glycopeptide antibiotics resistance protein
LLQGYCCVNGLCWWRLSLANLFYWWSYSKSYNIESNKTCQEIMADYILGVLGLWFAFSLARIFRHVFFPKTVNPERHRTIYIMIFLKFKRRTQWTRIPSARR